MCHILGSQTSQITASGTPHRSQQQQYHTVHKYTEEDEKEEVKKGMPRSEERNTRRKREEREQERRSERGRRENERRREAQGVRKGGEEGGIKVVEVETDWVTVKRRIRQRSQQERDERNVRSGRREFKGIQVVVKVDNSKTCMVDATPRDKVSDIMGKIPNSACYSKRDVHVTFEGRVR